MKKLMYLTILSLVVLISAIGCSQLKEHKNSANSSTTAYGINAEVTEVGDDSCVVKVTGNDQNFDINDVVTVTYTYIYKEDDSSTTKLEGPLKVGDPISITYFDFQKKHGANTIDTNEILLIN